MIVIGRTVVHPYLDDDNEPFFETKEQILETMASNQEVYTYKTDLQLAFDLHLRLHLILSCIDLSSSGIQFRSFQQSYCNNVFWEKTKLGGFKLKRGMLPSIAIQDIFKNGDKYATECATAIIIIIYKALLACYDEETFNRLFASLLLYTWDYDKNLKLTTKTESQIIQGDIIYFKNPQVNPRTIEWQGENTIYLGDNFYYGHGVGISTAEDIINYLNTRRKPNAFLSAYVTDFTTRIDVETMSQYFNQAKVSSSLKFIPIRDDAIIATIGHSTGVY